MRCGGIELASFVKPKAKAINSEGVSRKVSLFSKEMDVHFVAKETYAIICKVCDSTT